MIYDLKTIGTEKTANKKKQKKTATYVTAEGKLHPKKSNVVSLCYVLFL